MQPTAGRLASGDDRLMPREQPVHRCRQRGRRGLEVVGRLPGRRQASRQPAGPRGLEGHHRPIGQDHLHREHPLSNRAVPQETASGEIAADHPTDGCHGRGRRVGAEHPSEIAKPPVEFGSHHPRLHPHDPGRLVDFHHSTHQPRGVNHDARPDGRPNQIRAGPAGMHRQALLSGPANCGRHIRCRSRPHHAQRHPFKQACIGGIQRAGDLVAEDLPRDDPPQVFLDPLGFVFHAITLPSVASGRLVVRLSRKKAGEPAHSRQLMPWPPRRCGL